MMSDDASGAIDYERLGHAAHLVGLAHIIARVEEYRELEAVLLDIRGDGLEPFGVLADRQHHEIFIASEFPIKRLNRWHFLSTWWTPGGPYIKEYHFAAQRGERNRVSPEISQGEIGGELASGR